jgi:two-component system, sensor histidine kinase and response regulator
MIHTNNDGLEAVSRSPAPELLKSPASAVAANEPAVDVQAVMSLREEGDDLLADLIQLFSSETPRQLTRIRDGLIACDWPVLRIAAHTLKGAAGIFGANRMRTLAAKIETAAYPEETDKIAPLLEQLVAQCERVRIALAEERARLDVKGISA